ncbi:mersacidin/lichenicidin family type 2 lantibiotic [Aetokthonos hydrillicola Thurmond2011]|uniref:Mersacidin/lichenicidin family type 2 lantibiotic n=1 Tax=Aetokthonos hydrillicola Thurmond2011 TaxID=2712845 RepID=A0AAP5M3T7_9CYAN|nr:mersacidin/lichenicidin family type 2 lantibiotic [Aetokthonos hydrillicola]MBO3462203.1 mersacidin/lichenicidin family type 2 lantibiotic [Aetokthonos hydrillicola CCALA 1050]MBW4585099.1 mersacidin/lichenicidin family type 2 lantibiotic [Aetokthonos hydrillicola CCALA 1050]MDR9894141.1 mersacidin/lichenicidin family type 2 lantibiotic [Aetokthonos hydrillicola Thurmond2011]
MSHDKIIRAWKDENYRQSLTEDERSQLPANPVGMLELTDSQLRNAIGGRNSTYGGEGTCNSGIIACTLPINCPAKQ